MIRVSPYHFGHDPRWARRINSYGKGYHRFDDGSRIHAELTYRRKGKENKYTHWTWIVFNPGHSSVHGEAISFWAALRHANENYTRMDAIARLGG